MISSKSHWRILRIISLNLCIEFIRLDGYRNNIFKKVIDKYRNRYSILRTIGLPGYTLAVLIFAIADLKFNQFGGLKFEQLLFFLVFPFTLSKTNGYKKVLLPAFASGFLLFIFYFTHVYSILYLAVCCSILVCLIYTNHQPTLLSFILAIITTPAVKFLVSTFSFPLRLYITNIAGHILGIIFDNIDISGNFICLDDKSFTVAHECMGLNMISSTLVFAIFILSFYGKKTNKNPRIYYLIAFLLFSVVLVGITNLLRIILTVFLQAQQDTVLHELIGLGLFLCNCCIPLFILGYYGIKFYKPFPKLSFITKPYKYHTPIILLLMISTCFFINKNSLKSDFNTSHINLKGFTKTESKDKVLKLNNDSVLIYVKPPAFILGSDHNPFICWKASGYQIKKEAIIDNSEYSYYSFELHKPGSPTLFSCWWYDNGKDHTISQWKWRISSLSNSLPYSVVNVTCGSKEEVTQWTAKLIKNNILKINR